MKKQKRLIQTRKFNNSSKLRDVVGEKRPELENRKGVVFQHENAEAPTFLVTRQKLLELGWNILSHLPYSPDLASSDYHLFRSIQKYINGKMCNDTLMM